jgi:hypothetical protein
MLSPLCGLFLRLRLFKSVSFADQGCEVCFCALNVRGDVGDSWIEKKT